MDAYQSHGSWQFLRHNFEAWNVFAKFLPGGQWYDAPFSMVAKESRRALKHSGKLHPSPPGHLFGPAGRPFSPNRERRQPSPITSAESMNWRIRVLDRERFKVFGKADDTGSPLLIPLKYQDETVGWLSISRLHWLEKGLEAKFKKSHLIAVCIASLTGAILSILVSFPLGRSIIKPVTLIMDGIRHIARGDLSNKVRWDNRDEFSGLVDDVNQLSTTLAANEKLRHTMMADVSHELRTPLAVLQAEIEAIQDGIRPCDARRLESLHRSVSNLSGLVDDLFDLSLADAGHLNYRKQEVDVVNLLKRSVYFR